MSYSNSRINPSFLSRPPFWSRIFSVWYRHMRVYTKHLISNGFPPFLEPLIFLAGIGLGLGIYIKEMDGIPYIAFLSSGLLMTTAMFTASFECTFGTYIRLEFDKVYDGMLASPLTAENLLIGEIIWAGTKGLFFSFAVLIIISAFGILPFYPTVLTPLLGFFTGIMFGSFSLFITSFINNINHFNFYFTGFLSPMFFFSGIVFPLQNLPAFLRPISEVFPLTHSVRLTRAICIKGFSIINLFDLVYIIGFIIIFSTLAVLRLKKRLID